MNMYCNSAKKYYHYVLIMFKMSACANCSAVITKYAKIKKLITNHKLLTE
jgi:hypothetical protein